MRSLCSLLLVSVWAADLARGADSAGIRGLVAGLVYDRPGRSIRPVIGAPGSAYLGEPLARDLEAAWVAPDGDQALALSRGSLYWLEGLSVHSPRWRTLSIGEGVPALVGWSVDSSAAAVYIPDRLILVHRAAGVVAGFSTESLGGRIITLAIADDAILAGVEGVGLYRLSAGETPALVARLPEARAILPAGSDRLLVADRARQEILEVRCWREFPEVSPFASAAAGVSDPAALAASPDGRFLVVASSVGRRVTVFDLASGALIRELQLDFEPTRLEPLGDGASWLLAERRGAGEALEVLTVAGEPAVFFIPAPAEESIARED